MSSQLFTAGFEESPEETDYAEEGTLNDISFVMHYKKGDEYKKQFCQFTNRNHSWKTALFEQQNLLLDLKEMTNVRYLVIDDFKYGCELTISLSEFESGPYVAIYTKKYFPRHTSRRINLSSLPSKYIKIEVSKGVHIHLPSIRVLGIRSKDIVSHLGHDFFKVMVSGPQRLMYK